jgi:surface carbohydrate biosynthesis protein
VNPKVVVSLLDNEIALYRLKAVVPNARVVAIQNGWRGITYDIFSLESSSRGSDLEADDVLVFGPAIGKRFESLVRTKTTPIGSFKSNLVPIHRAPGSRVIALVSTVRQKVDLDQYVPVRTGLSAVKYRQIFERRLELARLVYQFARREGFHLRVLGKDESIGREFEMYRHHLGTPDSSWSFTPRTTLLANYAEIDHAHAVISSSSTLGYEALGRGARSAFFMIDFEVLGDDGTQFGWPLELPKDGAFWTHSLEAVRIEEVLNNVALSTDLEWKVMSRDIAQELITFDSGNSLFARMMAQI